MSDEQEKNYSQYEAAITVLKKVQDMYKISKSNSSHELEPGEEPNNDDAECPDYLSEAESSPLGEGGENKKKKKAEGEAGAEGSQPEHEEGISEEEDKEHDAQEQSDDEQDSDNIEADEEKGDEEGSAKKIVAAAAGEKKEEKKNPFQKSEGQEYKPELMRDKGDYHENAQKSEEDIAKFCKYQCRSTPLNGENNTYIFSRKRYLI